MKYILLAFTMLTTQALANTYIYSQSNFDGIEVHVKQLLQRDGKMTLVLEYENKSDDILEMNGFHIEKVYYITGDKKYPVLKDTKGDYIGAPLIHSKHAFSTSSKKPIDMAAKSKKVIWFKFQSPNDKDWPIEIILPGTIPFVLEKPAS